MNMVEKVARALCKHNHDDPDQMTNAIPDGPLYPLWKDYEAGARAAIAAMRDPTPGMLEAGPPEPYMCEHVWGQMIDAAIEEKDA